jgi:L-fuconolactonase
MRPVGETEFVAGIAAMSDSGNYGKTRVAAGIVGYADLTLGDRVEPVLLAHLRAGGGRFRGVRHSAGWDADPIIGNSRTTCSRISMRGRISAPGSSGCPRSGSASMPGCITRSSPM